MYTTTYWKGKVHEPYILYEVEHEHFDEDLIQAISHIISQREKGKVIHTNTVVDDTGVIVYDSTQMLIPAKEVESE